MASSLAAAVKEMIDGVGTPSDANITYGQRNEQDGLPAITFLITTHETLSIGSTCVLKKATVEISSIAETAEGAMDIALAVENHLSTGTYATNYKVSAISNMNTVLEKPSSGFGDETLPYTAVTTIDIFYSYFIPPPSP